MRLGPQGRAVLALHDRLGGRGLVEESAWLFRAARGRSLIVTIGTDQGRTPVLLAEGSRWSRASVVAIDRGAEAARSMAGIERVEPKIMTPLQALSLWDGAPIDLLFVDGAPGYADARLALDQWGPLVAPGGTIALREHDRPDEALRAWRDSIDRRADLWSTGRSVGNLIWATRASASV